MEDSSNAASRSKRSGARTLTGFVLVGIVLATASLAWACGYEPRLRLQPPFGVPRATETAPGELVTTVVGGQFNVAEPVEIRWNSTGGPLLATAYGPEFRVSVTIPANIPPGVYYVVARPASQGLKAVASQTYQVRAPSTETRTVGEPVDGRQDRSGPDDVTGLPEDSKTPGEASSGDAALEGGGLQDAVTGPVPGPSGSATQSSGQVSVPAGSAASANSDAVATGNGRIVFGPSVPPSPDSLRQARAARAASGDAWSGFDPITGALSQSLVGPSETQHSPGAGALLAIGMVALGSLALLGGFVVAETRRRRAAALVS